MTPPLLYCSSRAFSPLVWRTRLPLLAAWWLLGSASLPALQAQVVPAASPSPANDATAAAVAAKGTLLDVLKAAGKYSTLLKAVEAAGMTATLGQPGPFTIFAPTDDAFNKLPAGTLDRLLKPESKAKLVAVINYHIAPGKITLAALAKVDELKTLNGEEIDVDTSTDGKTIEMDDSKIVGPEVEASNGVVHTIDVVLQP